MAQEASEPKRLMLDHALAYAARGWRVFPLHNINRDGHCTCGYHKLSDEEKLTTKRTCSPGKHPRTKNGLKDATIDEKQIRAWWQQWPYANIGGATGPDSEIVILDPDEGGDKHGLDSLDRLRADHGQEPDTLIVETGGGGYHLYFNWPGVPLTNSGGAKLRKAGYPDIDVRASGGYVVLPPSNHQSGNRYKWGTSPDTPIADLPPAWLALLTTQPRGNQRPQPNAPRDQRPDGAKWLQQALDDARGGNRNDTGLWLACQLRDAGLSVWEAEPVMLEYAARVSTGDHPYTEGEALASLRQAYSQPPRAPARRQGGTYAASPSANSQSASSADTGDEDEDEDESGDKETQSQTLIRLAARAEFFRSTDGRYYARVPVRKHFEIWPLGDKGGFRLWLGRSYYYDKGRMPNATAMAQAIDFCKSEAQFGCKVRKVFTRLGYDEDGAIYIDMGDAEWRAIQITAAGWRIVTDHPVAFMRPDGMLPIPTPASGGSLDELRQFINVESADDWHKLIGWLVGAYHPRGPYPVLCIHGQQGSAKSSATRYLRRLIDPAVALSRAAPQDIRDLNIMAYNSWVIALENLSHIPGWLSDALCRLSTTSGFSTRALYEDDREKVFDARRPVILNGIEELATKGDLLDRSLIIYLPRIDDANRKYETDLDAAFEAACPRIYGALLDVISAALRNEASTKLDKKPRMADFARWVTSAEPALKWERGAFMRAYEENRENAQALELEASPVARALLAFMRSHPYASWKGTASELEAQIRPQVDDETRRSVAWPKTAKGISGALKRIVPLMRSAGYFVEWGREGDRDRERFIQVARIPNHEDPAAPVLSGHETEAPPASAAQLIMPDVMEDGSAAPAGGVTSDVQSATYAAYAGPAPDAQHVHVSPGLEPLYRYPGDVLPHEGTVCRQCGKWAWFLSPPELPGYLVCKHCHPPATWKILARERRIEGA